MLGSEIEDDCRIVMTAPENYLAVYVICAVAALLTLVGLLVCWYTVVRYLEKRNRKTSSTASTLELAPRSEPESEPESVHVQEVEIQPVFTLTRISEGVTAL